MEFAVTVGLMAILLESQGNAADASGGAALRRRRSGLAGGVLSAARSAARKGRLLGFHYDDGDDLAHDIKVVWCDINGLHLAVGRL